MSMRHPHSPISDCNHNHAMVYENRYCWCNRCGQTWKMLHHQDGEPKTWYPLPIREMERGARLQEFGWGRR